MTAPPTVVAEAPARPGAPVAAAPVTRPGRARLLARDDGVVVHLIWLLMLISVQPWSRSVGAFSTGGSDRATGKGAVAALCVALALLSARQAIRGRVPALWWWYGLYAGFAVTTTAVIGGSSSVGLRVARLALVLAVPLLLWPKLRGRPTRLISAMFAGYAVLGASVLLGLLVRPGAAFGDARSYAAGGRLMGVFLPMLPTRVGELGAVICGFALLHWAYGRLTVAPAGLLMAVGVALLVLSRTRTASAALLAGMLLAALVTARSEGGRRLRRALLVLACVLAPATPLVLGWVTRKQSANQLTSLTGRTVAWNRILHLHPDIVQLLLGRGLGHTSIFIRRPDNTLGPAPIDSSWITVYYESGLIGLAIVAVTFLVTVRQVLGCGTPFVRACCVFLITYVVISSVSETGLSDASSLLLMLMVAAMSADIDRRRRSP